MVEKKKRKHVKLKDLCNEIREIQKKIKELNTKKEVLEKIIRNLQNAKWIAEYYGYEDLVGEIDKSLKMAMGKNKLIIGKINDYYDKINNIRNKINRIQRLEGQK